MGPGELRRVKARPRAPYYLARYPGCSGAAARLTRSRQIRSLLFLLPEWRRRGSGCRNALLKILHETETRQKRKKEAAKTWGPQTFVSLCRTPVFPRQYPGAPHQHGSTRRQGAPIFLSCPDASPKVAVGITRDHPWFSFWGECFLFCAPSSGSGLPFLLPFFAALSHSLPSAFSSIHVHPYTHPTPQPTSGRTSVDLRSTSHGLTSGQLRSLAVLLRRLQD